ncbi:hypothetical protein HG531_000093 [Fusarium graminearum]|nr:hypothetical protein HG531_000093 [Fusarium graminearum]
MKPTEEKIGKDTNDDHEESAKRERNTEENVENNGPDLRPTTGGEKIRDNFLQVLEHETTEAHAIDDRVEAVEENKIGCFNSDVASSNDCNTDVSSSKGGGVVNTITSDSNNVVAFTASALFNCGWDLRTVRVDDAEHTNDGEVLNGRVGDLVTKTVCASDRARGNELFTKNNDTFSTTGCFVLDLLEPDACVAGKGDDRVGLSGPVLGTTSEENIGSTLDDNAVSTSVILGLEDAEDSAVCSIAHDGTLLDGEMDGCGVKGCVVAEKSGALKSHGRFIGFLAVNEVLEFIRRLKLLVDKSNGADKHLVLGFVINTEPANPSEENGKCKNNSHDNDNRDKAGDFLLDESCRVLDTRGRSGNATHYSSTTSEDNNTNTVTVHNSGTHESNVATLEEVGVSCINCAFNLIRLSSQDGTVEADVAGVAYDAEISRDLVADLEMDDIAGDKIDGSQALEFSVTLDCCERWEKVEDGVHGLGCRPILKGGETSLEEDDDEDENSERKVLSRRSRTLRKTSISAHIELLTQLLSLQLMVLKLGEVILVGLWLETFGVVGIGLDLFGFGDLDGEGAVFDLVA